jgi:hypothetical protein
LLADQAHCCAVRTGRMPDAHASSHSLISLLPSHSEGVASWLAAAPERLLAAQLRDA